MGDYLLDAHALLWFRAGDKQLGASARAVLEDPEARLVISEATFWELCIKIGLGKLEVDGGLAGLRREWIGQGMAETLPIEWPHLQTLSGLPMLHRDPFDRLLIAQAITGNMVLLTGDRHIAAYPQVRTLW